MKPSTVVIIIAILLLFGGAMYLINQDKPSVNPDEVENLEGNVPEIVSVNYLCEDGSSIAATYDNAEENVTISLSDERVMTLDQVVAASGARYANADESIVFWNKGNEAFVEEDGNVTFADCVAEGTPAEETEGEAEGEAEEAPAEAVLEEDSVEDAASAEEAAE